MRTTTETALGQVTVTVRAARPLLDTKTTGTEQLARILTDLESAIGDLQRLAPETGLVAGRCRQALKEAETIRLRLVAAVVFPGSELEVDGFRATRKPGSAKPESPGQDSLF